MKWQQIQGEIAEELDVVKNIMMSLSTLRLGSQESLAGGNRSFSYEEPTRDGSCYAVKVRLAVSVRLLIRHEIGHSQMLRCTYYASAEKSRQLQFPPD